VSRFRLIGCENHRDKFSAGMGTVTKRLVGGESAGAVSVFLTGFEFDLFWAGAGDFWFVHGSVFDCKWVNLSGLSFDIGSLSDVSS
jgi:hypothetical protein